MSSIFESFTKVPTLGALVNSEPTLMVTCPLEKGSALVTPYRTSVPSTAGLQPGPTPVVCQGKPSGTPPAHLDTGSTHCSTVSPSSTRLTEGTFKTFESLYFNYSSCFASKPGWGNRAWEDRAFDQWKKQPLNDPPPLNTTGGRGNPEDRKTHAYGKEDPSPIGRKTGPISRKTSPATPQRLLCNPVSPPGEGNSNGTLGTWLAEDSSGDLLSPEVFRGNERLISTVSPSPESVTGA